MINKDVKKVLVIGSGRSSSDRLRNLTMPVPRPAAPFVKRAWKSSW